MRAIVIACVLALAACGPRDDPAREQGKDLGESPSAKQAALWEAFGSASAASPGDAEVDKAELNAFFSKLGADQRASDGPAIVASWDYVMTLDLVEQQGFALPPGADKLKFAAAMGKSQAERLKTAAKFGAWDQHEITKIVYLDTKDRDELQLYLRQYSHVTGAGRTRWWLRKRQGSWAVYDFEELTAGLRMSTIIGVGLVGARDKASWGAHSDDLMAALQAAGEGRLDDVESSMKKVRGVKSPAPLQAYIHYIEGSLHVGKNELDAALSEYDRGLKLNPNAINVQLARMSALNLKGDFKAALEAGGTYEAAIGTDADLKLEYARARKGLKETEAAERLLKSCLDEVADQTECLGELAELLPPARQSELDSRLTKLKDFDGSLRGALDLCTEHRTKLGARALLEAAKRVRATSPVIGEYGPRVKAL